MLTSSSELHIACLQQVKAQTDYYNSYYLQTQNMVLQSPWWHQWKCRFPCGQWMEKAIWGQKQEVLGFTHTWMTRLTNSVIVKTTAETLKVVFSTISNNSNRFIASTSLHITRKIIRHYHTTYQKQSLNLLQTSKKYIFPNRKSNNYNGNYFNGICFARSRPNGPLKLNNFKTRHYG